MNKKLLAAIAMLLLLNLGVYADEIRLTSSKTDTLRLGIVTSSPTTVAVDWGNGVLINTAVSQNNIDGSLTTLKGLPSGEIIVKGDGLTVFDCSLSGITNINVSQAPNLIKLSVNNNSLTSIDLSNNTALASLHLEINPGLSTFDLSKNTALQFLYCNDNNIVNLDVTMNTQLATLNFNNNKIVSIDLTKNLLLKTLYATTNQIESINLSNNTALTYISLNTNKLTSLDVSTLTALKSLFLVNNNLSSLIGANTVAKTGSLNCTGNKLNLATLPQPEGAKTFTYAPQQAYVLPTTIYVNASLDLSSQTNLKGITTTLQATNYVWNKKSGAALLAGTDYLEDKGVFKFLVPQSEPVICSMTTNAFPNFKTTNIYKTTEMSVLPIPTSVSSNQAFNFTVAPNPVLDKIKVNSETLIKSIELFNSSATRVLYAVVNANTKELFVSDFPAGIYLLKVNAESGSSTTKIIIRK